VGIVRSFPRIARENVGLPEIDLAESDALLDRLWAHATTPELTFRQVWEPADLILWDNRCTLHRRDSFDATARRIMHRTQIKGPAIVAYEA